MRAHLPLEARPDHDDTLAEWLQLGEDPRVVGEADWPACPASTLERGLTWFCTRPAHPDGPGEQHRAGNGDTVVAAWPTIPTP